MRKVSATSSKTACHKTCSVCNKQIKPKNFHRHLQSHRSDFACDVCDYVCSRKDNLSRHQKRFHSESSSTYKARLETPDSQPLHPLLSPDEIRSKLVSFTVTVPATCTNTDNPDFIHPFSCKVLGPRGSGKTSFVLSYISQVALFTFHKIVIVSNTSATQDCYNQLRTNDRVLFLTAEELSTFLELASDALIVLDDIMQETRNSVVLQNLYTKGRHKRISVISLEQDLFYSNPIERRNVDYFVLMSIRDTAPLQDFYKRFCRDLQQWRFIDLYSLATSTRGGYLIIDFVSPNFKYRICSFNSYYCDFDQTIKHILPGHRQALDTLNDNLQQRFTYSHSTYSKSKQQRKYNQHSVGKRENQIIADSSSVSSEPDYSDFYEED
jgi:uncharacterized pyridoxamine 5'-phosphate oxidase family protein